ncbi:glycine oxidase ThiO [Thermoleophilia bacterium SCSIO 60948]|nr:glycine oxidase ThiO [Thermoleophilia bacterium SCSIO 60948]
MTPQTQPSSEAPGSSVDDVLIVGGGVIGLATAWRLAGEGLRVRVLEAEHPGAGASGVAAGMLAPVGEASWGEDRLLAMALRSHGLWPGFAAELERASGGEVGFLPFGAIHVALDADEAAALHDRFELMQDHGLVASWLRPRECRRLEPGLTPALAGGVSAPHEAAVDPRMLLGALERAARDSGVAVELGAAADELLLEGGRVVGVRSGASELRAATTVLAAGSWSAADWLPADSRPPVRPVKGQILTLKGPAGEPVCERIVCSERIYMVPRGDGRLIVGATVEELGFDRRITARGVLELLREGYRALPDVAELELVETIAGLRPATPDNLPLLGPAATEGLVFATGHFRNGILLAPFSAAAITDLLLGREPPAEARAADPARFTVAPAR